MNAAPLALNTSRFERDRMKVRGFPARRIGGANPHPTLSLAKGEAEEGSK